MVSSLFLSLPLSWSNITIASDVTTHFIRHFFFAPITLFFVNTCSSYRNTHGFLGFFIGYSGTLPESPPDSGSEPPYSPTDLHVISNLNQITYQQHNYPTNSQPANPHQLDQAMHVNETSGVDCHTANLVNGNGNNPSSSIHKTEDILLSSTAMPLPNSVSNMMLPGNEMMMHQNVSKKNQIPF